jgi:hypothetical protein
MPDMDARFAGVFMLLSTQQGWAKEMFKDNSFAKIAGLGIDDRFLSEFSGLFSDDGLVPAFKQSIQGVEQMQHMSDIMATVFGALAKLLADNGPSYSPPPCPRRAMPTIVDAINRGATS